jgi:NAD(P)H-flavin reductase
MATPQKLRCQVQKITDHGDHVYTVDLVPERPLPRFKPGQFLHLTLDDYDPSSFWPESRIFSIASSPAQRNHLKISYSVKGKYTTRMENELQEDRMVWVKLPYGDFVIQDANNVALLAGGTGITAFISFIDGLTNEFHNNIFLAYGARKPELLLYRDLIDAKAEANKGFHAFYFVETNDKSNSTARCPLVLSTQHAALSSSPSALSSQPCLEGCLSLEAIWNQLENSQETSYYIAGPPAMIQALTDNLLNKKILPEMIKVDAWE